MGLGAATDALVQHRAYVHDMRRFPTASVCALLLALVFASTAAEPVWAGPAAHARSAAARPDLAVAALAKPPSSRAAGSAFAASARIANRGRAAAGRSLLAFYLSRDKRMSMTDPALVGRPAVRALARGGSATVKANVRIPATVKPGPWFLIACADSSAKVRESNEANNCRTAGVPISVTQSTTPAPGPTPTPAPTPAPAPTNPRPQAGSWHSTSLGGPLGGTVTVTGVSFTVLPDQATVYRFSFTYDYSGVLLPPFTAMCSGSGLAYAENGTPTPIVGGQFSGPVGATGPWYQPFNSAAGGTGSWEGAFDSPTTAHGTARFLWSFVGGSGCFSSSGTSGPFTWTATVT